jgi:hypothetical protein
MQDVLMGGRAVDLILILVALEAAAVLLFRAATRKGPQPLPFLSNLLAGAFLLIALRSALAGAPMHWIALSLLAALVAHLADLIGRWDGTIARDTPRDRREINATVSLRVDAPRARPTPRQDEHPEP